MALFAGLLQTFGVLFLFVGDSIFASLGVENPEWFTWMKDNKMMAIGGFWIFNSIATNLVATGAFEVTLNGQPIFSKLEAKRMPTLDELVRNLERAGMKRFV